MQRIDVPREYEMSHRRKLFFDDELLKNSSLTIITIISMDAFDTRYFRINKLLLSYAGLWPLKSSSNKNIILYCTILGILIVALPQVFHKLIYLN